MDTRAKFPTTTLAEMRRILDAVRTCPHRGSVLPPSRQPECGCAELSECRADLGHSGAVTLEDCVRCRCGVLGIG